MRSENREGAWRAGVEGGLVAVASLRESLTQRDRKRGRCIVKPLCFSSWCQANSLTDTRWWPVSRGPVCLTKSWGQRQRQCPPLPFLQKGVEASTFGLPDVSTWFDSWRPLDAQVLFACRETERGWKGANIQLFFKPKMFIRKIIRALNPPSSCQKNLRTFIIVQGLQRKFGLAEQTLTHHRLCKMGEKHSLLMQNKNRNTFPCSERFGRFQVLPVWSVIWSLTSLIMVSWLNWHLLGGEKLAACGFLGL